MANRQAELMVRIASEFSASRLASPQVEYWQTTAGSAATSRIRGLIEYEKGCCRMVGADQKLC